MTEQDQNTRTLEDVVESVSNSLDADILFYNGNIERPMIKKLLINVLHEIEKKIFY